MTISLPYAPTAMNSSLTETAWPNQSPAAPSDAVSFAEADVLLHPVSGSVNTYAAPTPSPFSFPGAPTSTVLPLAETEYPNRSPDAPSDAVNFTEAEVSAQPVLGFVKTYAMPAPPPPGVPTTMVSPGYGNGMSESAARCAVGGRQFCRSGYISPSGVRPGIYVCRACARRADNDSGSVCGDRVSVPSVGRRIRYRQFGDAGDAVLTVPSVFGPNEHVRRARVVPALLCRARRPRSYLRPRLPRSRTCRRGRPRPRPARPFCSPIRCFA